MSNFKIIGLSLLSLAASSSLAAPCDGFQIKVANQLDNKLMVTTSSIKHARINPHGINTIENKTTEVFTVSQCADNQVVKGKLNFYSLSMPPHGVRLKFALNNINHSCKFINLTKESKYNVKLDYTAGQAIYTISN